jgi:methylated-DNA-[protein]-cysteine S-methyltransferase
MMTDTAAVTAEHGVVATRLGELTIVRAGDRLTGLYFPHHWHRPDPATFGPRTGRGLDGAARQLEEYLGGARQRFDLPLRPCGSALERRVWELIAQVPYGRTITYGDLARRVGGGVTPREVGAAVGANPLSILIPCHRVIGSTGKLTGYAGGLARKRELLDLERGQLTVPA